MILIIKYELVQQMFQNTNHYNYYINNLQYIPYDTGPIELHASMTLVILGCIERYDIFQQL